jgi:uncharacterized membrane protein HdeD (DUF308 family)
MSLIKDTKVPATKAQSRVQAAVWALIYSGLLTIITGYTLMQTNPAPGWQTGETLILVGSLATAAGAVLIYIRSLMQKPDTPPKETSL